MPGKNSNGSLVPGRWLLVQAELETTILLPSQPVNAGGDKPRLDNQQVDLSRRGGLYARPQYQKPETLEPLNSEPRTICLIFEIASKRCGQLYGKLAVKMKK